MGRRPAWPASAPQGKLLSCEETRTPGSPREGHTQLSAPWTCSLPTSQSPSGAFRPGFPQRGFPRRWSPHTPCGPRTPCPRPRGGPGCSAQRLCDGGAFEAALSGPNALTGMAGGQMPPTSSTFEAKVLGCSCHQALCD